MVAGTGDPLGLRSTTPGVSTSGTAGRACSAWGVWLGAAGVPWASAGERLNPLASTASTATTATRRTHAAMTDLLLRRERQGVCRYLQDRQEGGGT